MPAKKMIKQIKGHAGDSAWERCTVYGKKIEKIVTFIDDLTCTKCTNETFRNMDDHEHHMGLLPILLIKPPVDMIKEFPLE